MAPPTVALNADAAIKSVDYTPAALLATLGVTREQFSLHQEQMRRSFLYSENSSGSQLSSLPYPLNLPPSYPTTVSSPSATAVAVRLTRPSTVRQGASVTSSLLSKTSGAVKDQDTRAYNPPGASSSRGKGKRTLDAFMHSRQTRHQETESSGSDSDMSLRKILPISQAGGSQISDSCALPSSSPPSSSPLRSPRESSPVRAMYAYPSSPTPKPKRQPSMRVDASDPPYTLPPGPYSHEKPTWSLAALIGQAINASFSGALPLNDIYNYISTVYPHFDRRDQPWMSSVRHSLSVNDAFERVPDLDGTPVKKGKGKGKGKTRLKGGLWRIKPGFHECFTDGNFIRKGAKGPGPGMNLGGRKRMREEEDQHSDKKPKGPIASSSRGTSPPRESSQHVLMSAQVRQQTPCSRLHSSPPLRTSYTIAAGCASPSAFSNVRPSSPPPLTGSQSTYPSEYSILGRDDSFPRTPVPFGKGIPAQVSPSSPERSLSLTARRNSLEKAEGCSYSSALAPGFELEMAKNVRSSPKYSEPELKTQNANRNIFAVGGLSSTYRPSSQGGLAGPSKASRASLPSPPLPNSSPPARPSTPPTSQADSSVLSPVRTPISHKGLQMGPSRSLAHYTMNLEPEWKLGPPSSPPSRQANSEDPITFSTPQRTLFPKPPSQSTPFRTPASPKLRARHVYDPYDPNTLLADELARIRDANEPQESPGGFFGKEGRKLLYESPSIPGRSDWRFRDEV